ncbi:hypothetical protein [Paenibacillus sp. FSL H8-0282]|uniref:hypothetical protein n=1 Tax=unclassified Paenibacillus TaxID=185978 RepID=UPI00247B6257|nr:hypothetical protein [Paenibacillus sp. PastH-4]MDH6444589.1 hypothetical protein [Paenibacillus sp. PastF-4]MDH6528486.1 hypothetical protein [Paenibacillus sp. PastH-3]
MKQIAWLYHYYDESTGPFQNLSDLPSQEAEQVLNDLRQRNKGFASKRSADYLDIRRGLEAKARELFIIKGGKPSRACPHYMTLGECPGLLDWYPRGKSLQITIEQFDPASISFTYGDLFPTMRYKDGKPYRNQVYTWDEIIDVIDKFGMPQEWNANGDKGPERYIEVQIWDDKPLINMIGY